ncbi:MAG TPA: S8 family serine peptidase, partial [Bdellovibrionota bacterium]|nr:S8 family serine peptidase [Bdellovibrionota bacterium]
MKSALVVVVVFFTFSTLHAVPIYLKRKVFDPEKIKIEISEVSPLFARESKTKNFLVQFKTKITDGLKRGLNEQKIEVLAYIPENTLILRLLAGSPGFIKMHKNISWIEPYHFTYKISENITPVSIFDEDEEIDLSVRTFNDVEQARVVSFLNEKRQEILAVFQKTIVVRLQKRFIYELALLDDVEWLERYYPPQLHHLDVGIKGEDVPPPDNGDYSKLTGYESGSKILNLEGTYRLGLNGRAQIVAVADTGISQGKLDDTLHFDLEGQIYKAYAVGLLGKTWEDFIGHGTHVAGSIVGNGTVSGGKIQGVAYGAHLVAQSLITGFKNMLPPANIQSIFEKAYNDGARIHSNSWGVPFSNGAYETYSASIDAFTWEHMDFLPVFAVGNDGGDLDKNGVIDADSLSSPSVSKNCLAVGASENVVSVGGIQRKWGTLLGGDEKWSQLPISEDVVSDNTDGMAAFSSRGPTQDGRVKPDVVTPGTNILSLRSSHPDASALWGAFDAHYVWGGGTSMSTPIAAGAAALVRQYYQDIANLDHVSSALIKATLMNGAFDMYPGQFGDIEKKEIPYNRPNVHEGWGRLDIDNTLLSHFLY